MAVPRVFISSTCHDLAEVRDSVVEVIEHFGFEAVRSERGDIAYDPVLHTHESCRREVLNCQLLILIIGGRFGNNYIGDTSKSIVNVEYEAAKFEKIPVFTFVRRDVLSDYFVFKKNQHNTSAASILYPSIENQEDSRRIFAFIEDVFNSKVNNGVMPFDFARNISEILRKQWAGLFFRFLQDRRVTSQLEETTTLLQNISRANGVVEELLKSVVRQVDKKMGDETIKSVESIAHAKHFFVMTLRQMLRFFELSMDDVERLVSTPRKGKWYQYLSKALDGKLKKQIGIGSPSPMTWLFLKDETFAIPVDNDDARTQQAVWSRGLQASFEEIHSLKNEEIRQVLSEVVEVAKDSEPHAG